MTFLASFALANSGLLDDVDHVLAYRFRFLDATALPALADRRCWSATTAADLFKTSLIAGPFPLSANGAPRRTALGRGNHRGGRGRGIDTNECAKIAEARNLDRLIFFNLRVHNKSWLEQAKGAIAVAVEGVARGLRVGLFLDGHARLRGCRG